ncbi:Olfactory receptor 1052 [Myotis brandtii]|uniref:Olfactory receptor 1052 n=2 Tax=Myotis brandtii TaxID=109478 RepID=S7Q7Z8_MYOBR|nr:Olfactory receptor 1052 [Myotis brandtii]
MFFFGCFADAECLLLAAMAYDRYAAICNPLLYPTLMSSRVCVCFIVLAYLSGSMTSMVHVCLTFTLPFCGSNIVNHFFCDIPPLLALSCADTHINELLLFVLCGFIQTSTFMVIFISYFCSKKNKHMADVNFTLVTEFILLGLTDRAELKVFLFVLFLLIYTISLVGNLGMLFLIHITPKLQTPMYHFLSCLSFVDACYSSVFAPKMLLNFFVEQKISFSACIVQYFLFVSLLTTEGFLLAAMAYDRYMAIANPLLYTVAMTKMVCVALVIGSCVGGLINSLTHTIGLMKLSFCGPNVISHFFCDLPPLLKLSCSDTSMNELLLLIFSGIIALITFLTVMISYFFIVTAILRIRSAAGRHRAFSTCASHLTAVTLFYGSISFSYIQPSSQYSLEQEKVVSVFYTLVIPMLNPLIYSLRNKEVKDAVKRAIEIKYFPC